MSSLPKAKKQSRGGGRASQKRTALKIDTRRGQQNTTHLPHSGADYRSLFEHSLDAVLVTVPDGTITAANPAACAMFGMTEEEICRAGRESLCDVIDPRYSAMLEKRARSRRIRCEVTHVRKDGTRFPAEVTSFILDGGASSFVILRDLTRREQAEDAMRQQAQIINQIEDAVVATDLDGLVISCNKGAEKMLGYPAEELLGKNISYVYGDHQEFLHRQVIKPLMEKGEHRVEVWLKRKSGEPIYLDLSLLLRRDTRGIATGMIGFSKDITARKRAEQALFEANNLLEIRVRERTAELQASNRALAESEQRYRRLFATISDAVMVFDAETRDFVEVNEAALRLYGYTREEFLQLKHSAITAEPELSEQSIRLTIEDDAFQIPLRYHRKKDGTIFPAEISGRTFMLKGRVVLCGVVRDVTRRKQVQETLENSEQRWKILFEYAPDTCFLIDLQGTFANGNQAAEDLTGYRREELIGKNVFRLDLLSPDGLAKAVAGLAENAQGRRTGPDEYTIRRKDGNYVHAEIRAFPVNLDNHVLVLGSARDITQRRQAEEALRRREQELADFFSESPLGLLWVGLDGLVLRVNQAELALLARSAEEVLGYHVGEFHLDPERTAELLARLAHQETVHNYRLHISQKNGSFQHVLIDANGFWDQGRLVYSRWFVRDVTDRISLEREILSISEREQRRIGEDLHDDLCQQLAGIEFLSQTLAANLAAQSNSAAAQAREIAQMIRHAMNHTRELAHGLSPIFLEGDGLIDGFRQLAARTRKLFKCECHFRYPTAVPISDPAVATHLYHIAQEAIANAVKHGRARRISLVLTTKANLITLRVSDDGVGIPENLDNQEGLGLQIMRHRADVIGGSLTLQRRPGSGTAVVCTVKVALPRNLLARTK